MRNGMRSLSDFDAEDGGGDAMPPTETGYGPSQAAPLGLGNIGPEIQARLQAGDPPGKIAMQLEQLEPGLGRALLGQINQAAGSMKPVSLSSLSQQNYGGSPARTLSVSPGTNGMPRHQNFLSGVGGDSPQAIYGSADRSVGVNPPRLISAGVSVPSDDKAGVANGFHVDGRTGPLMLDARSQQNRPAYRELAYKPDDKFWAPRPKSPESPA